MFQPMSFAIVPDGRSANIDLKFSSDVEIWWCLSPRVTWSLCHVPHMDGGHFSSGKGGSTSKLLAYTGLLVDTYPRTVESYAASIYPIALKS